MGGKFKNKKKAQEDDSNGFFEKMRQEKEEKKKIWEEKRATVAKKREKWQKQKFNRRPDSQLSPEELAERVERREALGKETREIMDKAIIDRNARKLFVKFTGQKFPDTIEEIKALDPLIKSLYVPDSKRVLNPKVYPTQTGKFPYAHIYMESEEAAEKVKKNLEKKKFKGGEMIVDYVGDKAGRAAAKEDVLYDSRRLHVFGLKPEIGPELIKKMFPRCNKVQKPKKGRPNAFIQFSTVDDARAAFHAAQDLQIGDFALEVNFAVINQETKERFMKKVEEKRYARICHAKKKRLEDKEKWIKRNLGEGSDDESESPRKKKKTDDDSNDEDGSDAENDNDDSGDDYENDESDDE